ncbi:metalloprotease [Epithele typhae]|uniref:metalloprotease n=1 Tax=Epithele typhae TaxID=378194 RepID=UPI00200886C4|nr:metalloprotease [Epithele typhae]KAH9939046.1 metalloprotease [Epithele typhae]
MSAAVLPIDAASQSNWHDVVSEHVDFDWTLDFQTQTISGTATHTLRVNTPGVQQVVFDTQYLDVTKVIVEGRPGDFTLGKHHEVMGAPLSIRLPINRQAGDKVHLTVHYSTTHECAAVQWLDKQQTQGKTFPFMFSQCQPIYARSMAPLQDTASAKITYTAKVASVLPTLLSAIRVSPPSTGPAHDGKEIGKDAVVYEYKQPIPIPTYLIAIAAGNFRYRAFPKVEGKDWNIGIWAEPELIDAAYWEFSEDVGRFLSTAETILPPYRFGVYDVLVLPPSFPYGGMENACLTFLTPTLLVGDRTLVDVVVHELTHSWFGNGVTQANSTHFWLNEGWTTYMERVLLERLHTPADRGFSFLIGYNSLKQALKQYVNKPKYQRLVINFDEGEDPDDAYSTVPYEKGSNFILHLERTLGGLDVFLPYVYDYVHTFMGKSITTEQWKEHLYGYWSKHGGEEKIKALDGIKWDEWFYGEGLELPDEMEYDLSLATDAYALAAKWDAVRSEEVSKLSFSASDVEKFNANQKIVFLERLQSFPALPSSHINLLGEVYSLASSTNAELRWRFYEVALLDPASPSAKGYAAPAAKWVTGNDGTGILAGRMKFCRPTFRAIARANRELAVEVFNANKLAFHPIARRLIEKDLGLA